MQAIRWLLTAALGYLAIVAYTCAFAAACFRVSPEFAGDFFSAYRPVQALVKGFEVGSYAGFLGGPLLGFIVLAKVNEAMERPEDDRGWWPVVNIQAIVMLLSMTAVGSLMGGGGAILAALKGRPAETILYHACVGAHVGSVVGVLLYIATGTVRWRRRPAEHR
ncbi:MAG: hypothetical protein HYY17_11145 [Planctomycetes bacterium]|nr:hypothetical protein [Planctomycetota bacterium]